MGRTTFATGAQGLESKASALTHAYTHAYTHVRLNEKKTTPNWSRQRAKDDEKYRHHESYDEPASFVGLCTSPWIVLPCNHEHGRDHCEKERTSYFTFAGCSSLDV